MKAITVFYFLPTRQADDDGKQKPQSNCFRKYWNGRAVESIYYVHDMKKQLFFRNKIIHSNARSYQLSVKRWKM